MKAPSRCDIAFRGILFFLFFFFLGGGGGFALLFSLLLFFSCRNTNCDPLVKLAVTCVFCIVE